MVVLALVGFVGWGQLPELWWPELPIPETAGTGPIEVPSSFQIPASYFIWVHEGYDNLDFPQSELEKVTDPDYVGHADTNTLIVYLATNTGINVTGEAWGFKGKNCEKLLLTEIHGYVHYWTWEDGWQPFPNQKGWYEIGEHESYTYILPNCVGGYYFGWMHFRVWRNRYEDPADTYEARIRITVSGI